MKNILGLVAALALSSVAAFGGPCSTTTDMYTLNGLGTSGCTFAGLTFSNFFFSNYQDNAFANSSTYTVPTSPSYINEQSMASGLNMQNYIVNFTQNGIASVTVTITPNMANGWMLSVPWAGSTAANFAFELKYNISPSATAVQSISGQTNVNVAGTPNVLDSSVLQKGVLLNGQAPINNSVIGTGSVPVGNNTFTGLVPNSTVPVGNFGQVVDNYVSQLASTSTATMNTVSIANTFTLAPEPMSLTLMGAGLIGLALFRRRTAKK